MPAIMEASKPDTWLGRWGQSEPFRRTQNTYADVMYCLQFHVLERGVLCLPVLANRHGRMGMHSSDTPHGGPMHVSIVPPACPGIDSLQRWAQCKTAHGLSDLTLVPASGPGTSAFSEPLIAVYEPQPSPC